MQRNSLWIPHLLSLSLFSCINSSCHYQHLAVKTELKRSANIRPHGELHVNVQRCIIHHSAELDTAQMPIAWGMQKQNCATSHTVEYCSEIKSNRLSIHVKSQMNLKSLRSRTHKKSIVQLIYMKFLEKGLL